MNYVESVRKLDQIVVKTGRSVVDFKSSVNESTDKANFIAEQSKTQKIC